MNKTLTVSRQSGKMSAGRIFLILFALGFGAIGAGLCYSAHKQEKTCSAVTEGRVIECRKYSYIGRKNMFTPVVEYQVGSKIFTGETNARSSSRAFETGEYVTIGYDPANPEEFYIKSYDLNVTARLGMLFLIISGAILVIIVTILILNKIKISKERKETIQVGILVGGIVCVIFVGLTAALGPKIALCVFGGMGLFVLYEWFRNKRMKKKG